MDLEESKEIPKTWRIPAIMLWFLIAGSFLAVYIADLPISFEQTSFPCQEEECHYQSITTAEEAVLEGVGLSTSFYATYIMGITIVVVVTYAVLGLFILYRQSHRFIGLLVSLTIFVIPAISISNFDIVAESYPDWALPVGILYIFGQFIIILFFIIFPSGRLEPRWTALILALDLISSISVIINAGDIAAFSFIIFFIVIIATAAAVFVRYRNVFTPVEKQQAKWAVAGFFGLFLGVIVWGLTYEFLQLAPGRPRLLLMMVGWTASTLLLIALPIGLTVSILRYRLWDIDLVVRRTLVYGSLTVILIMIYFAVIVLLQNIFTGISGQESPIVLVISTLVIAALFQPLRRRVQDVIDRRFFRRKYDAAQTLAQFARAAQEEVDLDPLTAELLSVVRQTMQPERVTLWLREDEDLG